jgi:hypothetical protein
MQGGAIDKPWSIERAADWQRRVGWLVGCNYTPAYAAHQVEFWSRELFDVAAITRELADARALGFNVLRVYLHDLAFSADPFGMLERVDRFLGVAAAHSLGVVPVIFDSVWHPFPEAGRQSEPRPGVHNAGWLQSPGIPVLREASRFCSLEGYVHALFERFGQDPRIVFWDLWNEPDNANPQAYGPDDLGNRKSEMVRPLLEVVFAWARARQPFQPLTTGVWTDLWDRQSLNPLQLLQLDHSDIVTFHCYDDREAMAGRIANLRPLGRPIVCTEYMARPMGSTFASILPLLAHEGVGAISWGLHRGRTQTHLACDTWGEPCQGEPELWFHDILWPDGRPYLPEEADLIRQIAGTHARPSALGT